MVSKNPFPRPHQMDILTIFNVFGDGEFRYKDIAGKTEMDIRSLILNGVVIRTRRKTCHDTCSYRLNPSYILEAKKLKSSSVAIY